MGKCDYCGDRIREHDKTLLLKLGRYTPAPLPIIGNPLKHFPGRQAALIHVDCVDGFKAEDAGRQLRNMIDYLAEGDDD